jgi:hypothetical protein
MTLFQGKERDIIFLSMVADPEQEVAPKLRPILFDKNGTLYKVNSVVGHFEIRNGTLLDLAPMHVTK